jgi:2-iminoacetate synthase
MDLAKPGLIKLHCLPNAITSFAEYLHDFASPELKAAGFAAISSMQVPRIEKDLQAIAEGARDVYV